MKNRVVSRNKSKIRAAMNESQPEYGDEYTNDDLSGYQLEANEDGLIVTRPAPVGEPRHYHARTNTGGRRFVC